MTSVYYVFAPDDALIPPQADLLAALRRDFGDRCRIETETPMFMPECIYVRYPDGWFIRLMSEDDRDLPGDRGAYYRAVKKDAPFDFTHAQRCIHVVFADDPDDMHGSAEGLVMLEWLTDQVPGSIVFAAGAKVIL